MSSSNSTTTFVSFVGQQWAIRHMHRLKRSPAAAVLRAVADWFSLSGVANPSTQQIIERAGKIMSRGQVLREINHIEAVGLWRVSNRHAGRGRTLVITACDWETDEKDSTGVAFSTEKPRESPRVKDSVGVISSGEKDSAGVLYPPEKDSRGVVLKTGSIKTGEGLRQEEEAYATGVASPAAPTIGLPLFGGEPTAGTPPASNPPADPLPSPQAMLEAWNAIVATTPLPPAIQMTGRRAGQLKRVARHPKVQTLDRWQDICRFVAGDPFYRGERNHPVPITIERVATVETIEAVLARMEAPPPPRDWSDVPASEFGPEDVPTGEPPVDDLEMGRLCNPFADLGISWDEHMADVRAGIVECRDIERGRAGGGGIQQEHHHAPAAE